MGEFASPIISIFFFCLNTLYFKKLANCNDNFIAFPLISINFKGCFEAIQWIITINNKAYKIIHKFRIEQQSIKKTIIFYILITCIFQKFIGIIKMYRVLLKVDKVHMRIKQAVDLHIIIKKAQLFFTHCKNRALINGQVELTESSQFYVESRDPSFEIEIYLIMNELKKRGGVVVMNLKQFTLNASHTITAIIQKSPLQNSSLQLTFTYIQSNVVSEFLLVSLKALEQKNHQIKLKQMVNQNGLLLEQKERLDEKIQSLKQKNLLLENETKMLEEDVNRKENVSRIELEKMKIERDHTFLTLATEKKKIASIVDIINQSGDFQLINEMGNIISQN